MNNGIYRKGLAVVLIIALTLMTFIGIKLSRKEKEIKINNIKEQSEKNNNNTNMTEAKKEDYAIIIVDIDGAVNKPGVYEFVEGDRVNDAIIKAGGLKEKACTKNINKARKLIDGEKIYVAEIGEDITDLIISPNTDDGKININTATKEMLLSLDGIGEVYSMRIIEYREKTKFSTIEEIKNVSGIGEKTFEKIKNKITVE